MMKHFRIAAISLWFLLTFVLSGCSAAVDSSTKPALVTSTAGSTEDLAIQTSTQVTTNSDLTTETPINQETGESSVEPYVFDTLTSPVDGMQMVFIPAGEFMMGSEKGVGDPDEQPQHEVKIKAFWMDQVEVTNGLYQKCVDAGVCSKPKWTNSYSQADYFGNPEFTDFPVIYVDWYQAKKYCQWANRRLPTEAEWEFAARGMASSLFPWGNNLPDATLANYYYQSSDIAETGRYPKGASAFGALDMAGNVAEWVSDWYAPYPLYTDPSPQGPAEGKYHILRGGSWITGEYLIRSADRYWVSAYFVDEDTGFRCAVSD